MSDTKETTITGTTITPTTTLSPIVDTNRIRTQQLTLSGNQVSGISSDHSETDEKKLATIFAVSQTAAELHKCLSELGSDVADIYLSPVLSPPLASPTFSNLNQWDIGKFIIDAGKAIFISRESDITNQTTLRLMTEAFHKPGLHYLDMDIDVLPNDSTLTIQNEKSVIIKTINTGGRFRLEFQVDNPAITYLDFIVGMVPQGYSVIISSISVHYVKTEFESYMTYTAGKLLSGGSGFASIEDINRAVDALDRSLKEYVNAAITGNTESFQAHLADTTNNPHSITAALISAAKEVHKHPTADVLGLTEALAPVAVCVESLQLMTTVVQDHFSAHNPHDINIETIGAAKDIHSHVMTEIDQLDMALTELRMILETGFNEKLTDLNMRLSEMTDNSGIVTEMLRAHEQAEGNVHNAVPKDFDIVHATTAEAISGTSATLHMSPATSLAQLESWSTISNIEVAKLCPRYCGKFALTPLNLIVKIPVVLGVNYQILLSGLSQYDLRKLQLKMNGTIISSISTPTITTTLQQDTGTITKQFDCPSLKFLPDGVGYTTVHGGYQFNTQCGTLIGRGVGYVLNNDLVPISTTMDLINVVSGYNVPIQYTALDFIELSIESMSAGAVISIDIFELISAPDVPIVADGNKAGTIIRRFGSLPLQDYSLLDGSEIARATFLDLWNYANSTGAIITKQEWDSEIAANGYCESFHSGDTSTTFGLPKYQIIPTKINEYIKLKNTFLPSPVQLITQYLWN